MYNLELDLSQKLDVPGRFEVCYQTQRTISTNEANSNMDITNSSIFTYLHGRTIYNAGLDIDRRKAKAGSCRNVEKYLRG